MDVQGALFFNVYCKVMRSLFGSMKMRLLTGKKTCSKM